MRTADIVGRDQELAFLDAFLDREGRRLRAVVLEGEAGVGKSTLWWAGVAAARRRGFRVLSSRPTEAERGLAHVVLTDLLEGVVEEVLPALPAARRRALEVAMLMGRPPEYPLDPRALAVAVRTAVEVLAEERPLVLAVDDSQWLDASSAAALAFALRRLRGEHVLVLLARRLDEHAAAPGIEESVDSEAIERLPVGPLSMGAMHVLLQGRLDRPFARPTLLRLHEISGGNPFYALELARELQSAGTAANPTEPLPVPVTLERLVGARLVGFKGATRAALLLAAAHGRPSTALLGAAGIGAEALEQARAAGVLERSEGEVRFTHPLLASVLYNGAPEDERRGAHRRLAAVVADPVERARHLALASDGPEEEIAAALEDAATHVRARGTTIAAAELAEHALRLTPPDAPEDHHRRAVAAAHAHLESGDVRRARALALELLASPQAGRRAEALVLLSDVEYAASNVERSIDLRREALEAAGGLPSLQAEIHERLAQAVHFTEGVESAGHHAATALELAEALGDDALRAGALSALAHGRFQAGDPDAAGLVDQAARLAAAPADPRRRRVVLHTVVHAAVWSHQFERARTLLESIDHEWSDRDELVRVQVLWWLGLIELRSGSFSLAAEYGGRAREIWRQYTIDDREEPVGLWLVALIAAHRGDLEQARALVESYRPRVEGQPLIHAQADAVLGLAEMWSGRPAAAAARFAAATAEMRRSGHNEPAMFWWCADYAEALLELGGPDEAAALVDAWERQAARLGREALLAEARRCRGLVAAARGDVAKALNELERAVAQHLAIGDSFGRARALLALGTISRRARRKRAARQVTESAVAIFEECGAKGWADKARAELGHIGGRRRELGLTSAEHRVAVLVVEGRTNREVAAALFLGAGTVETHLSHIYSKLGVRSRTELARVYTPSS